MALIVPAIRVYRNRPNPGTGRRWSVARFGPNPVLCVWAGPVCALVAWSWSATAIRNRKDS